MPYPETPFSSFLFERYPSEKKDTTDYYNGRNSSCTEREGIEHLLDAQPRREGIIINQVRDDTCYGRC
jgi:hypothetical protein